jgi:hypothetical protein
VGHEHRLREIGSSWKLCRSSSSPIEPKIRTMSSIWLAKSPWSGWYHEVRWVNAASFSVLSDVRIIAL